MTNEQRDQLLADTHDTVVRIEERCYGQCRRMDRHDLTLYGNGRAGLVAKVYLLWALFGLTTPPLVAYAIVKILG